MTQQQAPRVTIASRLFAPETGAAAYRLKALANGLAEQGAKVRVITTRPPHGLTGADGDYQVSRWPVLRDAGGNVRGYIQYLSFDIPLFFRLLLAPKPDVVVVEPPPTTGLIVKTVCWLRRIPYVYFSADVSSSAAKGIGVKGPALRLLTWMERWVLKSAAGILAVSEGVRQEVRALTGREHGIHMVGTGVDTDTFSPVGDAKPDEGAFFVYAGTMSEIQGAGVFVDAFALIAQDNPDVRLLMFGQGVELEALKARAASIGPQVQFRPPISGSDVASYFRSAIASLASVRPGKGYDFAFATKSLAGLAAGAPTIYAGVGPMVELIEANKLGIASEWDPASVALAMKAMIANPVAEADRSRLSAWTEEHFSLRSVGQAGAERVLSCMKVKD